MQRKLLQRMIGIGGLLLGTAGAVELALPAPAHACGGLFCNSNRAVAVNQAAEQILFAKNADGSVTAVIQIMYEGSASKFAWVLPVTGVPTVGLSSDQAFTALKGVTNPSYQINYQSTCTAQPGSGGPAFGNMSTPTSGAAGASAAGPAVTVKASGAIGPYDYVVIEVNPGLSDRAMVAVDWLATNQYDVGPMGADMLRPYLMSDMNLIAFKLTKGATTGSIRPVMLNFGTGLPAIPIRPTAVAANDDMGVLVWVLADSRAIPQNYKGLELNDALIDWFMPNNNYNKVISKAADEAGGQGFVTEFAGKTDAYKSTNGNGLIYPQVQKQNWERFMAAQHPDGKAMVQEAAQYWAGWDGYDDALRTAVTLPATISYDDFKNCLGCYFSAEGVSFDSAKFLTGLYEKVIKPMAATQALIDAAPYLTRLYTTMSASEMTLDPAFDFNSDLGDVSNFHSLTMSIGCSNGPWTATFPQGTVSGATRGVWPIAMAEQPAALKIVQYGKQGAAKVIEDRTTMVTALLRAKPGGTAGTGAAGTSANAGKGAAGTPGQGMAGRVMIGGGSGTTSGTAGTSGTSGDAGSGGKKNDGGCAVAVGRPSDAGMLLFAALAALRTRRKRAR